MCVYIQIVVVFLVDPVFRKQKRVDISACKVHAERESAPSCGVFAGDLDAPSSAPHSLKVPDAL